MGEGRGSSSCATGPVILRDGARHPARRRSRRISIGSCDSFLAQDDGSFLAQDDAEGYALGILRLASLAQDDAEGYALGVTSG
ncbi:hypothetical protein XM48_08590 [Leucobacter sp. Ag1]|nr:hypothetical protein XM48_08590 [Leucobacter sp. Ag1]